jgi:hypothetical protein
MVHRRAQIAEGIEQRAVKIEADRVKGDVVHARGVADASSNRKYLLASAA